MTIKRIGNLEIQPEAFKPSGLYWRVQNWAYILMVLLLLGVFLGLAGPGIFGNKSITDANNTFRIDYDHFTRQQSENNLQLHVKFTRSDIKNNIIKIWGSQSYISVLLIKQMLPKPVYEEISGDKIIYHFLVAPDAERIDIQIMAEPYQTGCFKAEFGIVGGAALAFKQIIYP